MTSMGLVSTGRIFPLVKQNPFEAVELILQMCAQHGKTKRDICGRSRRADVVKVRHLIMIALYVRGYPTTRIGDLLGKRDHTTVIAALRKHGVRLYGKGGNGRKARLAAISAGELK